MILQSFIFPNRVCDAEELYFRGNQGVKADHEKLILESGKTANTDTYFNLFDSALWKKYTGIEKFQYQIQMQGKGVIELCYFDPRRQTDEVIASYSFSRKRTGRIDIPFSGKERGYHYLRFFAVSKIVILEIVVCTSEKKKREVCLGINICTYRREEQLRRNICTFLNSKFFDKESILYGKARICIVDNGSELTVQEHPFITLIYNKNTGGSGGFARGIQEFKKQEKTEKITHVVFMDDDVLFIAETFYRLYALLSYLLSDYQEEVIAGRMFRMDDRAVQYTAVEKWNRGDILHVGFQKDMTKAENLVAVNDAKDAEYTGWWLGCFSMEYVKKNMPLPFFLHCDDVEYGLRHGGTPIILNGIQVWHETYEYRQNPTVIYYDLRNSYLINDLYNLWDNDDEPMTRWKEIISKKHLKEAYLEEYMLIQAFLDYTKGIRWLKKIDSGNYHEKLKTVRANRFKTAVAWRIAEIFYKRKIYHLGGKEENEQ